MQSKPDIVVSSTDYNRLGAMLDNLPRSEVADLLASELERARILDTEQMPADVVMMHTTVKFTVLSTGRESTYTLSYPREVNGSEDKLSVLTPVGSALIGMSVGQEIEWPLPDGKATRVRIDKVIRQPEISQAG